MGLSGLEFALLLAAVGLVAFLYASVGHGGATGYLAVMSLLGVAPVLARPGALWLNVFVASVAFWRFRQAGLFEGRIFVPLACASIPMAWLGSRLHLDGAGYGVVLGVALLGAGWLLGWGSGAVGEVGAVAPVRFGAAFVLGGGLGFLAGLTGIGGGVYLTPALILLRWAPAKTAGGISALFIVVNSVAGLVGLGDEALMGSFEVILAPLVGGAAAWMGTTLSVRQWNATAFRRMLAVVLWIAALQSLIRALN